MLGAQINWIYKNMMNYNKILILLFVILLQFLFSQGKKYYSYFQMYDQYDPVEFLKMLKKDFEESREKNPAFMLGSAPNDWIKKEHIPLLMELMYDTDTTKSLMNVVSSFLPYDYYSCVGREAQNIIDAYRNNEEYPNFLNSAGGIDTVHIQGIEKWWAGINNKSVNDSTGAKK